MSRSERPQNRKRNHPRPPLLETTRVDGVRAPRDAEIMQKFAVVALHAQAAQPVAADDRAVLLRELLVGHARRRRDRGAFDRFPSGLFRLVVSCYTHGREDVGDKRLEVEHELIKVIDRRWARAPALRRGGHGFARGALPRRRLEAPARERGGRYNERSRERGGRCTRFAAVVAGAVVARGGRQRVLALGERPRRRR